MNKRALALILLCPVPALAQAPMPSASSQLLQIMLALGFVLAMIYGLGFIVKRFGQGGSLGGTQIKVVSSLTLGNREKLVITEVNGEQLLLGVTANSIRCLKTLDSTGQETATNTGAAQHEAVVDFKTKLAGLMVANKKPV
ncbi:MAG: flagellar biosynthetic protein FliO [Cellvibrionaceae bacterium]|nr:flagellar biosynthetic protein FliO [Cellvibrionaceae bacterium]